MSDQGAAPQGPISYEQWVELHAEVFKQYWFPHESLGPVLYEKLLKDVMDVGSFFGIDTQADPTLIYTGGDVMKAGSNVFVCDHCWSADPMGIYNEWKTNTQLRERLAAFCENPSDPSPEPLPLAERLAKCDGKNLDLDELEIEKLEPLQIPEKFPNLESLSLWGNKLNDTADLLKTLAALPNLRGLWIQGNPIHEAPGVAESVLACCRKLEIFDSKFTSQYGEWALLFAAHSTDPKTVTILDLSDRGIKALNQEAFKNFLNLANVDFTGNDVDLSHVNEVIKNLKSIKCDNTENLPKTLVFVNGVDTETGDVSLAIPDRIWDHIQPAGNLWGLGDEVALSIHHSLNGNFAAMPCGSPKAALTYFVFWPIADIAPLSEVTANLFPKIPFGEPKDLIERKPMVSLKSKFHSTVTRKRPIKVFTDLDVFAKNLHSDKFELVSTPEEADLQWIVFRDNDDFTPIYENKILFNQIEGESNITIKDLMYETVKTYMGDVPWLPETFVLCEPENVARFLETDKRLKASGQSAAWVVKAFNQTRATYMIVTESASEVLRHASVDPRLTQRYLWNPLLIYGLKFDLRFIVLLKSVKPMELYAYKVFWPRLAPKRWALDNFDDYERHFTVMNYRAPDKVTHKTYVDFVEQFGIENPDTKWDDVLWRIYRVIRDLFICGCQKMVASPYTKAMYGIDMMLTNEMQPVVLECNFQPDCHRACDLCPTFVDDVFEVLYTDQPVTNERVVQIPLED